MDENARLITVDNGESVLLFAKRHLAKDERSTFTLSDGVDVIRKYPSQSFDMIFAGARDGKYFHLDETIALLIRGGIYFIDDMLPQANWLEGHQEKANDLIIALENHQDLF